MSFLPKTYLPGSADYKDQDDWIRKVILRMLFLNAFLSIAGIGTGLVALYAALTQAYATQAQLEASVRPELVFAQSYQPDEPQSFVFLVSNNGNGPARMRAMRISVDGIVVRNWTSMLDQLAPSLDHDFDQSQIAGRLIQSSEAVEVFSTQDPELASRLFSERERITVETCYCSLFDECWTPPKSVTDLPMPSRMCDDFGEDQFLQ